MHCFLHKFPVTYLYSLDISNYMSFLFYQLFGSLNSWPMYFIILLIKLPFTMYFTKHKVLFSIPLQGRQFYFFSFCLYTGPTANQNLLIPEK